MVQSLKFHALWASGKAAERQLQAFKDRRKRCGEVGFADARMVKSSKNRPSMTIQNLVVYTILILNGLVLYFHFRFCRLVLLVIQELCLIRALPCNNSYGCRWRFHHPVRVGSTKCLKLSAWGFPSKHSQK